MRYTALAALLVVLCLPAGAQKYYVTDIGMSPGDYPFQSVSVNNNRQVLCVGAVGLPSPNYIWQNDAATYIIGITPAGGPKSLNDLGQVVGGIPNGDIQIPAIWQNNVVTDLGAQFNLRGFMTAINNSGRYVGQAADLASPDNITRACYLDNGTFGYLSPENTDSYANSISANGMIAGNKGAVPHPFLWTFANGHPVGNDLGLLPGDESGGAYGVNDSGHVVGVCVPHDFTANHPFIWSNGVMSPLPVLAGSTIGVAYDINNADQIVGWCINPTVHTTRAVMWQNGVLTDLNTLIPANSGWTLMTASSINELGDICGVGFDPSGFRRPYLLKLRSIQSLTLNPTIVAGSAQSIGTVTLNAPAPAGGAVIALSSDTGSATAPASVTVPAGQTSATFPVNTGAVSSTITAKITAAYNEAVQTASLTVRPIGVQALYVLPDMVDGGTDAFGIVALENAAAPGPIVVNLSSSDPAATLPASVTVPAGWTTAVFIVHTGLVSADTPVLITASANGLGAPAILTVRAIGVKSVAISPSTIAGGSSATGTVTLGAPAPPNGTTVSLSSNIPAAAVKPTVTVPAGQTTAAFSVQTSPVATDALATINATANGSSASAQVTVQAAMLTNLTLNPTIVKGGVGSTGTVTVNGQIPAAGLTINLNASVPASVPASVVIPSGATSATFPITTATVGGLKIANISANLNGLVLNATLNVTPIGVQSLTLTPTAVAGGTNVSGVVTLDADSIGGPTTVNLTSTNPAVASSPLSIQVAQGLRRAKFTVTTRKVAKPTIVTITGSANGTSAGADVTVK